MRIRKDFYVSNFSCSDNRTLARNAEGHVIMYGDTITDSMRAAITETKRRREIQMAYNERTWHYAKDFQGKLGCHFLPMKKHQRRAEVSLKERYGIYEP